MTKDLFSLAERWAQERGVKHVFYPRPSYAAGDIELACPRCGSGRLFVRGDVKHFFCFGGPCAVQGAGVHELDRLFKGRDLP